MNESAPYFDLVAEVFHLMMFVVESLDSWEAMSLADCLEAITYSDGGVVVKQGEPGDDFFIIVNVGHVSSSHI